MEGDLSFEGNGEVIRSYAIVVSYQGAGGVEQVEGLEGFSAIIFQHETDHLWGRLLTDRIEAQKNNRYESLTGSQAAALLKAVEAPAPGN